MEFGSFGGAQILMPPLTLKRVMHGFNIFVGVRGECLARKWDVFQSFFLMCWPSRILVVGKNCLARNECEYFVALHNISGDCTGEKWLFLECIHVMESSWL